MRALILTITAVLAQGAWAADKAAAPDGKALFAAKCASCHGKDAKGNPGMAKMFKVDAAALSLVGLKDKDEDLAKIIKVGKNKMPKFQDKLGDPETAAVLAYIRSLDSAKKASN